MEIIGFATSDVASSSMLPHRTARAGDGQFGVRKLKGGVGWRFQRKLDEAGDDAPHVEDEANRAIGGDVQCEWECAFCAVGSGGVVY